MTTKYPHFELQGKRIFVAGHRGMVGSALMRRLSTEGCELLSVSRAELDLLDQSAVRRWISKAKPDAIVLAAAKVGGIWANDTYPADFLYQNLMIAGNIIEAAHLSDTNRLLFLGSSCIYPKLSEQPINEDALLTGPLEPTKEWYAVAKIAGIKLCQAYRRQHDRDYISAMPTNLYGPGDNFDLNTSHVLPAMIRKAHEAKISGHKTMSIWGSGKPLREFLHADDCADACIHLLKTYSGELQINVGSGSEISIMDLAKVVCRVVGFTGEVITDPSKPDGTYRKLMDSRRLHRLGWVPSISLEEGIIQSYRWYLKHNVEGSI